MSQTTNTLLMVRPVRFAYNIETAQNNAFQEESFGDQAQAKALEEFDGYVAQLRAHGVTVIVVEDTPEPHTPDSIFPNNWFTTHGKQELGTFLNRLMLYPMFAKNRREERNKRVLPVLRKFYESKIMTAQECDCLLSYEEEQEPKFLEGTGSLILDRVNRIAYACLSPRTNEEVLERWAEILDYKYCLFRAEDENGCPIYHTNVMMAVFTDYAIVCLDAITDLEEREHLIELLEESGKEIIEISFAQMNSFAGNMLEVQGKDKEGNPQPLFVMSATAKNSLDESQLELLSNHGTIIAPQLESIEKNGGGSARCMIAEIFLS